MQVLLTGICSFHDLKWPITGNYKLYRAHAYHSLFLITSYPRIFAFTENEMGLTKRVLTREIFIPPANEYIHWTQEGWGFRTDTDLAISDLYFPYLLFFFFIFLTVPFHFFSFFLHFRRSQSVVSHLPKTGWKTMMGTLRYWHCPLTSHRIWNVL